MSHFTRLLIAAAALMLASCLETKKAPPQTVERVIEVPIKIYVPIDPKLTKREPIANGPLREAPAVARDRKKALQICYGQLETIEKVQGTPVPPDK